MHAMFCSPLACSVLESIFFLVFFWIEMRGSFLLIFISFIKIFHPICIAFLGFYLILECKREDRWIKMKPVMFDFNEFTSRYVFNGKGFSNCFNHRDRDSHLLKFVLT